VALVTQIPGQNELYVHLNPRIRGGLQNAATSRSMYANYKIVLRSTNWARALFLT
jgi:hypothetical protein